MTYEPSPFHDQTRRRRVRNGTEHPRHVTDDVRHHEDVMHVVMVGRGDVDPATTGQRSDDANNEKDKGPRGLVGLALHMVLEKHEGKTWPRSQGDENLEETPLWIPVANASRKRSW